MRQQETAMDERRFPRCRCPRPLSSLSPARRVSCFPSFDPSACRLLLTFSAHPNGRCEREPGSAVDPDKQEQCPDVQAAGDREAILKRPSQSERCAVLPQCWQPAKSGCHHSTGSIRKRSRPGSQESTKQTITGKIPEPREPEAIGTANNPVHQTIRERQWLPA